MSWKDRFEAIKKAGQQSESAIQPPDAGTPAVPDADAPPPPAEMAEGPPPSDNAGAPPPDGTGEKDTIMLVALRLLDKYDRNPFKEYAGEQLEQLTESIQTHGVLSPLVVRPGQGGRFEILAGHNRCNAAVLAGLEEVPAILKHVDDDSAALIVTESNLTQREKLLPSEKAFAYKLQLEAMKRQAGRPAGNGVQIEPHLKSRDMLAEQSGESASKIQRYIRLTHLIPSILEKVDGNMLAISAAEHISCLERGEQLAVEQYFYTEKRAQLDASTAQRLRDRSQEVELNYAEIDKLSRQKKKVSSTAGISLKMTRLQQYVPAEITKKNDIEKYILDALDFYQKHGRNRMEERSPNE